MKHGRVSDLHIHDAKLRALPEHHHVRTMIFGRQEHIPPAHGCSSAAIQLAPEVVALSVDRVPAHSAHQRQVVHIEKRQRAEIVRRLDRQPLRHVIIYNELAVELQDHIGDAFDWRVENVESALWNQHGVGIGRALIAPEIRLALLPKPSEPKSDRNKAYRRIFERRLQRHCLKRFADGG